MFPQFFAIAALVATAQAECTLTRTAPIAPAPNTCLFTGYTSPCATPCALDFVGNQFGTLKSYACGLGTGYGYNCQCVFTSKVYTSTCPGTHTDTLPCVDLMPSTWCTAMCTSSITAVASICRYTCTCKTG